MSQFQSVSPASPQDRTFLGHPMGLFLLFFVEMWERFSYYGMRGILVLYLTSPTSGMRLPPPGKEAGFNPGPGWGDSDANNAYGWYTGLAYMTPILGGMIADKFIGTHRSMIVGGLLIALGHIVLGVSGLDAFAGGTFAMAIFVLGLALIVIGTGHFKPSVSVMVGQLYKQGDPRREGAFGIFYMGINLGAALQTYIVGTLGERVGWHWGFGAAAVGMLLGLGAYVLIRPLLLQGIGLPKDEKKANVSYVLVPAGLTVAALVAVAFHFGWLKRIDAFVSNLWVTALLGSLAAAWAIVFTIRQRPEDRGPVASIFLFMLFNAVFWLSFEQAGSSLNIFTDRETDRTMVIPQWILKFSNEPSMVTGAVITLIGLACAGFSLVKVVSKDRKGLHGRAGAWILPAVIGIGISAIGVLKSLGMLGWVADFALIPTTWFQSVNPWLIIVFAPITGALWTWLSMKHKNPSQPYKIGMGVLLVGLGYLFMVFAALSVKDGAKAHMIFIVGTYFVHTMGEIILSPTGLSYVTKAAPKESMSLLMGVWFISSFIANLGAGKVAALVEPILKGEKHLPWHLAGGKPEDPNTYADFFLLFVITSCTVGVLVLAFGPLLKKLTGGRDT
ncbi:Di-/tripeptide transporter [Phycisphaerales bacterium]|nr:Di-/tripeptide transporter [Phycisphaerales bacterium]